MIWSTSYHKNDSELNFNVQNACGSISKIAGLLLNFWWYSGNHFDILKVANCFLFCSEVATGDCAKHIHVWKPTDDGSWSVNNRYIIYWQNRPYQLTEPSLKHCHCHCLTNFLRKEKYLDSKSKQKENYIWSCQLHDIDRQIVTMM